MKQLPYMVLAGNHVIECHSQLAWLEVDLKKAHANRVNVPWIVVGMHRAIYTLEQCDAHGVTTGETLPMQQGFEGLLPKYNVDVVTVGHVHTYERHLPIARNKAVLDGVSADRATYRNPTAPMYTTSGAAGNSEDHHTYKVADILWNVLTNIQDYGISKLRVNRTALKWSFVATRTGVKGDEFMIVKQ